VFVLINRRVSIAQALALMALLVAFAPRAQAEAGPKVILVGDSVAKVGSPFIMQKLPGVEILNWDDPSQTSSQSLINLEHSFGPATSVVTFDTGVNDPSVAMLRKNLHRAAGVIGSACLIVPTIEPTRSKQTSNEKNRAIFEFATARPRTLVPEWSGIVEMQPQLRLATHGLHSDFGPASYRSEIVARAIRQCLALSKGRRESKQQPLPEVQPGHLVERALAGGGQEARGTSGAEHGGPPAQISVGLPGGIGRVVVSETGDTLYVFSRDRSGAGTSACYGRCAKQWPPLLTGGSPEVFDEMKVRASLLGTILRHGGAQQVTYARHPLYVYSGDNTGQTNGVGNHAFGGVWYPVHVDGKIARG
jgi:predicted lipoprotein with Yx(FWY)xxD motif